jgi:hypothetical protein
MTDIFFPFLFTRHVYQRSQFMSQLRILRGPASHYGVYDIKISYQFGDCSCAAVWLLAKFAFLRR